MLLHGPAVDAEVFGVYYNCWGDVWNRAAFEMPLPLESPWGGAGLSWRTIGSLVGSQGAAAWSGWRCQGGWVLLWCQRAVGVRALLKK